MSTTTAAGLLLIAVPLAFNAAFALLAARFDYPDVLRRPTGEVLAAFRAGGTALVLLWWAFSLTAVLTVPLVVLLSRAVQDAGASLLAVATTVGVLAAAVQFLGLLRWPFLAPYLARADADAGPARREAVDVVFQASTATSASRSASTSGTSSPAPGPPSPASRSPGRRPRRTGSAWSASPSGRC